MQEQSFLTPKDRLGYAEEYITIKKDNLLLKYSLSNSLEDIKIAVYSRTGQNIDLDKAYWRQNTELFVGVKQLMNKHHVRFSMTLYVEEKDKIIVINMRVGDKWFQTLYVEQKGKIHSFQSHLDYLCKRYFSDDDDSK
jgi:hypothetical protein